MASPMGFEQLTAREAYDLLTAAGIRLGPEPVPVERREERWLVRLPDDRLAWFAASAEGRRRLEAERRVLRLLAARCSFGAPRVLMVAGGGDFDVRAAVPATADPWQVYRHACTDPRIAARIGSEVGAILAEQHTRISAADVADWLPSRPEWPASREWASERLPRVVDDRELIAKADAVLTAYEALRPADADRVLVHVDVGFHNLAIDAATFAVRGVFDYDGAAWADRHHDFRYLLFDAERDELFEAAVSVYQASVACEISRARVDLYNAACAISFLAHRAGTSPEERCCGRTLAEDLAWTAHAIGRASGSRPGPRRR